MKIGLIILAAGQSRRLGQPKQLLPWRGKTLLRHAVDAGLASRVDCSVLVLGAYAEFCHQEISNTGIAIIENPDWSAGMASSLRLGLATLLAEQPDLAAVIIALCDQPFVSANLFNQLIESHEQHRPSIVAAAYANIGGVPALFDRQLFGELQALSADQGARALIQAHAQHCQTVSFPEGAIDIDTQEDYQELIVKA